MVVEAVQWQEAHGQVAGSRRQGHEGLLDTVCVVGGGFTFLLKLLG